jgi:NAD dependent epimerase/dehydratase family enzyme
MSEVVLESTRVRPSRLEAWGHRFTHPEHVDALHHTLGR